MAGSPVDLQTKLEAVSTEILKQCLRNTIDGPCILNIEDNVLAEAFEYFLSTKSEEKKNPAKVWNATRLISQSSDNKLKDARTTIRSLPRDYFGVGKDVGLTEKLNVDICEVISKVADFSDDEFERFFSSNEQRTGEEESELSDLKIKVKSIYDNLNHDLSQGYGSDFIQEITNFIENLENRPRKFFGFGCKFL